MHIILINHVFASEYRVNTMKEQQRIQKKKNRKRKSKEALDDGGATMS